MYNIFEALVSWSVQNFISSFGLKVARDSFKVPGQYFCKIENCCTWWLMNVATIHEMIFNDYH